MRTISFVLLLFTKARTILALGVRNVARVARYRLLLRGGMHPAQRIASATSLVGPFFDLPPAATALPTPDGVGPVEYFDWFTAASERAPEWHRNPFNGVRASHADIAWWEIPDFDSQLGDVKTVWEASRFGWVMKFAQDSRTGDREALALLNDLPADWCSKNPPYRGRNWKCGQESSVRVMHLAVAALLLTQTRSARAELVALVTAHMRRSRRRLATPWARTTITGRPKPLRSSSAAGGSRHSAIRWARGGKGMADVGWKSERSVSSNATAAAVSIQLITTD